MIAYDKAEVKAALSLQDIADLLTEWGGEPEFTSFGLVSATICHNKPGEGSRKLYFYSNTSLFRCYTGCAGEPSFDIFELAIKVFKIQYEKEIELNDAVRHIAYKFGIITTAKSEDVSKLKDWEVFNRYDRIQEIEIKSYAVKLKEYDPAILDRFNYTVKIGPWLREGISQTAIEKARIGYFPGGEQITIPHFDVDGRLIGIRGRALSKEDAERYGKYRPIMINKDWYNHPLGVNLYGLNWTKDNIRALGKAIVFESEKSVLLAETYLGAAANTSVACCGSNLSSYQVQLLLEAGAKEIIIAFDKQYEKLNTEESKLWSKKLTAIHNKYKNEVMISFLWDKNNTLSYKSSPIDEGLDKFMYLFKNRIML